MRHEHHPDDINEIVLLRLELIQAQNTQILLKLERQDHRMATLEETTVALEAAVDRIGAVLADVIAAKDAALAAVVAAQEALAASEAADTADDAAFAQQVADLQAALAAAASALQAQVDVNTSAADAISGQVDELNALG